MNAGSFYEFNSATTIGVLYIGLSVHDVCSTSMTNFAMVAPASATLANIVFMNTVENRINLTITESIDQAYGVIVTKRDDIFSGTSLGVFVNTNSVTFIDAWLDSADTNSIMINRGEVVVCLIILLLS